MGMGMPSARTTAASVLGRLGGSVRVGVLILDGDRGFPSLFALTPEFACGGA